MKRKIAFLAVLTICCVIIGSGTLAFFNDSETAHNVITTGSVDIELVETAKDENNNTVPFENVDGVMPGQTISKIVNVENIGTADAYVRVRVNKIIRLADGTATADVDGLIEIDFDETKWIEHDGYYYYNEVLEGGKEPGALTTVALFENVKFKETMGNLYQGSTVEIDIATDAVQAKNQNIDGTNDIPDVLEAAGWPAAN